MMYPHSCGHREIKKRKEWGIYFSQYLRKWSGFVTSKACFWKMPDGALYYHWIRFNKVVVKIEKYQASLYFVLFLYYWTGKESDN